MSLHPCLQYGGIREERANVGVRKGRSCYKFGVTGGWRVKGARKGDMEVAVDPWSFMCGHVRRSKHGVESAPLPACP